MSDTEKLRAAFAATEEGQSLTTAEIRDATGIADPGPPLTGLAKKKEILKEGERGSYTYRNNPDYAPSKNAATREAAAEAQTPKRARKKRLKGFKGEAREKKKAKGKREKKKTYRDLAQASREAAPASAGGIKAIALENYIAAGASLRASMRANVDGLDEDALLTATIENHERAEAMLKAAGRA